MRFFVPFVLLSATSCVVACVHEERKPASPVLSNENRPNHASAPPAGPPQYLVGDPSSTATHILALNGGAQGIVVDKRRVVLARGEPRIAPDRASETINGADRLPSRFGGGFVFWTDYAIYRADAFDAPLVPIARTPDRIDTISFGPKAMMVRTANGERWGIGLPKGERVPLAPLGLVDVVALDEGRALGFDDRGSVFTSVDHGTHWSDVTAQVKGQPMRVFLHDEELWLEDNNSSAMRLEPDGHLAWFDKAPEDESAEIRPRDPKWRGSDYPLRAALRQGVAIDAETALVLEAGDIYRIDVRTGDVVSVQQGKLPPDASCQGMAVPGDVIFACVSRNSNAGAFVVSHTLSSDGPTIEQSFGTGGFQFFASDDGGLVYGASCSGTPVGSAPMACVRMPSGTWEERDLANLTMDGGAGPADVVVARWVPRGDGRVVAIITDPQPGIYDPVSGSIVAIADELKSVAARGGMTAYYPGKRYHPPHRLGPTSGAVIDSTWSYAGNTLRGTTTGGESFEVTDDGKIKTSGWDFEAIYAQNLGVGRSKGGRLYQTSDHGASWVEVAVPPSGAESLDLVSCSSVGCDFGAFYRIGWQVRPPRVEAAVKPPPPAPAVRRVRGVELSCRAAGPVAQKVLSRTDDSPADLGLGNVRLPLPNERNDWAYVRNPSPRGITMAWASGSDSPPDAEGSPALRYLLSGYQAQKDDTDALVVQGPTKSIHLLRRGVAYVPMFDPAGRVVRTGIPLSEAIAAAKRAGVTADEFLSADPTENLVSFPITAADPTAVSDVGFQDPSTGLIATFRAERARLAVRPNPNGDTVTVFSAVALPGDETAILDTVSSGTDSHVYKVGPNGVVDLFAFAAVNATYHPANPDALAVGPKGELGIIRTPSGSDPPSELDPAYVVVQGSPPAPLAAWSTVKPADDPACKSEPGGWRTTLQTIGPWIRLQNPDLKVDDFPMMARVRWTPNRVCLEGFEVRLPSITVPFAQNGTQQSTQTSTWLVAKGAAFARVSVAEGIEWRQPLECTTVTTGP